MSGEASRTATDPDAPMTATLDALREGETEDRWPSCGAPPSWPEPRTMNDVSTTLLSHHDEGSAAWT